MITSSPSQIPSPLRIAYSATRPFQKENAWGAPIFSANNRSARWAIDAVDNLCNLRFQEASRLVQEMRAPFEEKIFASQERLEADVDLCAREGYALDTTPFQDELAQFFLIA